MALNETISILASQPSDVGIQNLNRWEGFSISAGLALLAFVGFVIRGLFIYYLTYEAQKDRTINELIYDEQVSKTKCVSYSV